MSGVAVARRDCLEPGQELSEAVATLRASLESEHQLTIIAASLRSLQVEPAPEGEKDDMRASFDLPWATFRDAARMFIGNDSMGLVVDPETAEHVAFVRNGSWEGLPMRGGQYAPPDAVDASTTVEPEQRERPDAGEGVVATELVRITHGSRIKGAVLTSIVTDTRELRERVLIALFPDRYS